MTGSVVTADEGLAAVGRDLIELVSRLRTTPSVIRVRSGDVSIELEWPDGTGSAPSADRPPADVPTEPDAETPELHQIRAHTVGAFYRGPAPGQPPFVAVGDVVSPGQQVAILEAMKIMIPVEADCHGRVVAVLPADSAHVEFDEPLLTVEPIAA